MEKEMERIIIGGVVGLIIIALLLSGQKQDINMNYTQYECDVKNFRLSTTIDIYKENEKFVKVSGDVLRFITDPLTMYDAEGIKTAYADDSYHFISQDSHSIFVNGKMTVEMVGLTSLFGEEYNIYDKSEKVANVKFNAFNTNGEMYDVDGNLIADFNSNYIANDFSVRITEECKLDEKTVLMIFCSYYSDQKADS